MKTQNERILTHLLNGRSINAMDALNLYGCFRLSARIHNLRETYDIETEHITNGGKTFASYSLNEEYRPL